MLIRKTEKRDLPALLAIYNHEVEHGVATLDLHPRHHGAVGRVV